MDKSFSPSELYDGKTLFTLSGASMAVWLFTSVVANVLNIETQKYKWIGLLIALFLAFLGAFSLEKKLNLKLTTIAFFNGLLIFITASGIDSINHNVDLKQNSSTIKQSALIPFTNNNIWWAPRELTDSIKILNSILALKEKSLKELNEELHLIKISGINKPFNQSPVSVDQKTKLPEEHILPSIHKEHENEDLSVIQPTFAVYLKYNKYGLTLNHDTILKPSYDKLVVHKIGSSVYFIVSNNGLWGAMDSNLKIIVAIKQRTEGIATSILEMSESSSKNTDKKKIGID